MACVDIRTVAELMSHRTLAMTMRNAHLAPQHRLDAVERLAAFTGVQRDTRTDTGDFGGAAMGAADTQQPLAIQ